MSTAVERHNGDGLAPEGGRKRLLRGFGATALGPVVTAITQVIAVPIFLHWWGAKLYGEWLVLSAVPTYLALSDMGFGSVAANDMTMCVAAGDRKGALESFQTAWIFVCAASVALAVLASAAIFSIPLAGLLNVHIIPAGELRGVLLLLSAYALGSLQATLIEAGFRCDGNYALGMLLVNLLRLAEALGSVVAVICGAGPLKVAMLLVILRWGGQLLLYGIMHLRSPWIMWGVAHATRSCISRMSRPAFAFMAFPAGNALSIQGMLVVIGVVLGPIAVATFSTLRTLTRFAFQILETLKNSIWPELSAAYGAENWSYARKLHSRACQAALVLCLAAVAFLSVLGRPIYRFWTHGQITFNQSLFHALLLVVIADAIWYTSSAATIACNAHHKIAAAYLAGTLSSLGLAYLLMKSIGLTGAAVALFAIDIPMTWYVLRSSLAVLKDSPINFLRQLCTLPHFKVLQSQSVFERD